MKEIEIEKINKMAGNLLQKMDILDFAWKVLTWFGQYIFGTYYYRTKFLIPDDKKKRKKSY